jgi:ACT domain-containing protein
MKTILSLETMTQLAVFLENRPGALSRVCEALAKAGVNIHALTVSDTADHSVVRMIVSDPTKALMLWVSTACSRSRTMSFASMRQMNWVCSEKLLTLSLAPR